MYKLGIVLIEIFASYNIARVNSLFEVMLHVLLTVRAAGQTMTRLEITIISRVLRGAPNLARGVFRVQSACCALIDYA